MLAIGFLSERMHMTESFHVHEYYVERVGHSVSTEVLITPTRLQPQCSPLALGNGGGACARECLHMWDPEKSHVEEEVAPGDM